jgi:hypothetical protein
MRKKLLLWLLAVAGGCVLVAQIWVPRKASLRDFDPTRVAELETSMWRAYYEKREGALFRDTSVLLRTQYHMPWLRSYSVAYQAARAAFVFKRGRVRADYEMALPLLESYYESIRAVSDRSFDARQVARLELEWWIVHRQRELHDVADLERALEDLQAAIYAIPSDRLAEHARLRAEAMRIRDDEAAANGVSDTDWRHIQELLRDSWTSLSRAVNS